MAKECILSKMVPGNTPVCPLDLQFYYAKYPMTAICRKKGCEDLILQRPDLHLCKVTGMRPDNMPGQRCPKDPPAETKDPEACTSPPAPEAPVIQGVPPPRPPTPAPCLSPGFKICPDFKNHIDRSNKLKGPVCTEYGQPLNQLPYNGECIFDRKKRLQNTPEAGAIRAGELVEEIAGAKVIKPAPYVIKKTLLTDGERDTATDALIDCTRFTKKDIEQIDELINAGYEGCKCRFDLIETAVMQYLAKVEGV